MNIKNTLKRFLSITNSELETRLAYRYSFGKRLDLKNPKTINEKLLWLKLNSYYNNELITKCIDKYKIREYLDEKGLSCLLPKLYGVYDRAEDIDWEGLPDKFVAKCNHGCGYNLIVKDKSSIDFEQAARQLNEWMAEDFWKIAAEIQYKYIEKKIIIEEYLEDLVVYKFFCFNGEPKVIYTGNILEDEESEDDKYIDYYDMNFNRIDCRLKGHTNSQGNPVIPENFEEIKKYVMELCKDFPFVRVDLYDSRGKIYISELTFLPTAGFMHIEPEGVLDEWGEWLTLDK